MNLLKDMLSSTIAGFKWKVKQSLANPVFYLVFNVLIMGIGLSVFDIASDIVFAWKFWKSSTRPSM